MSPFNGLIHSTMKVGGDNRLRFELNEKDKVIEVKNKEIIALTLQLEEIISIQNKYTN